MSVKELELKDKDRNTFDMWPDGESFYVAVNCGSDAHGAMTIDRNQAHLLMLYLQEHLK